MTESGAGRIGHGYDLHRIEPIAPHGRGKPMTICGVRFPDDEHGPVAHSDGDVGLRAVTDAVLGALGEPDLGSLFPDQDPQWKDQNSSFFVREAARRMRDRSMQVGNIDLTIICERPRIAPHRSEMAGNIASLLECDPARINVKGKTHERVDAVGEGLAIEAHCVVLLRPAPSD